MGFVETDQIYQIRGIYSAAGGETVSTSVSSTGLAFLPTTPMKEYPGK